MLEKDILKAIEVIKSYDYIGSYDEMNKYSRIYQNTTENIRGYMPYLDGNYKTALLPTSSGDHQLEAILNGISEITCYDINRFARYFTELKFCAIKNLTLDEYKYFMYEDMLNLDIFSHIKADLTEEIIYFWEEIFKNCDIENIRRRLFWYLGCDTETSYIKGVEFSKYSSENFTSYLEKDNYKLVQERIHKTNIEYIESNISEFSKILDKKYDLINLTNIYEFVNNGVFFNGDIEFTNYFKNSIPYLNDNGKVLITYLYKCSLDDIKKYKNKPLSYARLLGVFENTKLATIYDRVKDEKDKRTTMDKLYAFRNVQLLRHMKELDIKSYEIPETRLGCGRGNKDLVLIYQKK